MEYTCNLRTPENSKFKTTWVIYKYSISKQTEIEPNVQRKPSFSWIYPERIHQGEKRQINKFNETPKVDGTFQMLCEPLSDLGAHGILLVITKKPDVRGKKNHSLNKWMEALVENIYPWPRVSILSMIFNFPKEKHTNSLYIYNTL